MPRNEFLCDCTAVHQEAVDQVLAQMPGKDRLQQMADFYKLLGDPTRCRILCALLRQAGFSSVRCSDRLLEDALPGTTWFVIARK